MGYSYSPQEQQRESAGHDLSETGTPMVSGPVQFSAFEQKKYTVSFVLTFSRSALMQE